MEGAEDRQRVQSPRTEVAEFVAGAISGGLSVVGGQPLDTLKTRLQNDSKNFRSVFCVWKRMHQSEGWRGLFKGMSYPLITCSAQNALAFYGYNTAVRSLSGPAPAAPSLLPESTILGAGFMAGFVQSWLLAPVDVLKIRLQMQCVIPTDIKSAALQNVPHTAAIQAPTPLPGATPVPILPTGPAKPAGMAARTGSFSPAGPLAATVPLSPTAGSRTTAITHAHRSSVAHHSVATNNSSTTHRSSITYPSPPLPASSYPQPTTPPWHPPLTPTTCQPAVPSHRMPSTRSLTSTPDPTSRPHFYQLTTSPTLSSSPHVTKPCSSSQLHQPGSRSSHFPHSPLHSTSSTSSASHPASNTLLLTTSTARPSLPHNLCNAPSQHHGSLSLAPSHQHASSSTLSQHPASSSHTPSHQHVSSRTFSQHPASTGSPAIHHASHASPPLRQSAPSSAPSCTRANFASSAPAAGSSSSTYMGSVTMLRHVLRTEGVAGMFRGLTITMLRDCPGYAVYFWVYDMGCRQLEPLLHSQPNLLEPHPLTHFVAGGLAGSISWSSVYPMDVIKSRMQAHPAHTSRYRTWLHCAADSYHQDGARVFVRGMPSCVCRAFLVNAVIFSTYQASMKLLLPN